LSEWVALGRGQLVALAVGAVLVFWMVGAFNRLVALRHAITQVWGRVDDALRQRAQAAEPLLAALRAPLAAEQGALDTVQAALAEVARAAAAMSARPLLRANATAWVAAEAALSAAASRLFALLDFSDAAREDPAVTANAALWRQADARLVFTRQLFNEAAQAHDAAIALFPTRLLAPMFAFGPAGRL
jgi:LemA protein